jgi:hypothetical protein
VKLTVTVGFTCRTMVNVSRTQNGKIRVRKTDTGRKWSKQKLGSIDYKLKYHQARIQDRVWYPGMWKHPSMGFITGMYKTLN